MFPTDFIKKAKEKIITATEKFCHLPFALKTGGKCQSFKKLTIVFLCHVLKQNFQLFLHSVYCLW